MDGVPKSSKLQPNLIFKWSIEGKGYFLHLNFHCIGVGTEQYHFGRVTDQAIRKEFQPNLKVLPKHCLTDWYYEDDLSFSTSSKMGSLVSAAANYQSTYCRYDTRIIPHKSRASTDHSIRIHAPTLTCWKLLTVFPMLRPISGSCLGPNTSAATPAMTASSGTPSPKRHLHPSAPPPTEPAPLLGRAATDAATAASPPPPPPPTKEDDLEDIPAAATCARLAALAALGGAAREEEEEHE